MRAFHVAAVLVVLAALLGATPVGLSSARADVGYQDQSFSGTGTPTGTKRAESVLWWNDGSWWADMWDKTSGDFHIFRLETSTQKWVDTGVALDTRANTHADVLWDGSHLYVASHEFVPDEQPAVSGSPSYLFRYSYDAGSRTYTKDAGFPVQINNYKTESLVIDKDSTGKLWATWQQGNQIYVNRTTGDDKTWGTPFVLPVNGANVTVDDNSGVIAFNGNQIGVMWSNQTSAADAMYFAVHQDGDPDTTWQQSRTAIQGPSSADDHMNLKSLQSDGSGRVFAAVKTSFTTSSAPLIMLLVRDRSSGDWTSYPIARVSDCPNRPIVVIDEQAKVLHAFATYPGPPGFSCNSSGGRIAEKTSPLDNISFPSGSGTPVIEDSDSPFVHNVSSSKQNVNGNTGIALLAINGSTNFYWHAYLNGSTPGSLVAPTGLTAAGGNQSVALKWADSANSGNPNLAGYNVYRATVTGGPYTKVNTTLVPKGTDPSNITFNDTGLTNGTTYYYVVKAVDTSSKESPASNEASGTPAMDSTPPAAPTGLTATAGDHTVALDWADNTEADLSGYNVYRSTTAGGPYTQVNTAVVPAGTSSFNDTGLTDGTKYYYVVKAVDTSTNESQGSNEASATPLAAPTGLTAAASEGSVTVTWTDGANTGSDLAGYNVYRGTTSGGPYPDKVGSVGASDPKTFKDTSVTNGTTYYYVVRAADSSGKESPDSNQASATPKDSTPPAAPQGLTATAKKTKIILSWTANAESDLAGYNVYRSTTQVGGYTKINSSLVPKGTTTYTDPGRKRGTTYYYYVTAVDTSNNESGPSNVASTIAASSLDVTKQDAAKHDDDPPAAPQNATAETAKGKVVLDWDDNHEDDLAGYNVYRSTTSGDGYKKINDSLVKSSEYKDARVKKGKFYYYVLTAVDTADNESDRSAEATFGADSSSDVADHGQQKTHKRHRKHGGGKSDKGDAGDQSSAAWVHLFAMP